MLPSIPSQVGISGGKEMSLCHPGSRGGGWHSVPMLGAVSSFPHRRL